MITNGCGCCGRSELNGQPTDCITTYPNGAIRCADHHGRNPCAIEGCRRTRAAPVGGTSGHPYHADDQTLCGEHWRAFVPPRSRLRRTYHRYFAQATRYGWGHKARNRARLDYRFRVFWDGLIRIARRRAAEGHIDVDAINRLMGW